MHISIAMLNLMTVGTVLLIALIAAATSYFSFRRVMPGRTLSC
jgi:hypothetical protein